MNQEKTISKAELYEIRVIYMMAKACRFDSETGKQYTDKDFARDYMVQNSSMVSKVLKGEAVSHPVIKSILKFISENIVQISYFTEQAPRFVDEIVYKKYPS